MVIYNASGTQVANVTIEDGSFRQRSLMETAYVELRFSLSSHIEIPLGSYIEHDGITYTTHKPAEIKTVNSTNYAYTVRFDAPSFVISKYAFIDVVAGDNAFTGQLTEKWSFTGTAEQMLKRVVDNLNYREYLKDTENFDFAHMPWHIGDVDVLSNEAKTLEVEGMKVKDALSQIADMYATEWDCDDYVYSDYYRKIDLKKVEKYKNSPVAVTYGATGGVRPNIDTHNGEDPITNLYVRGCDSSEFDETGSYGFANLMLPTNNGQVGTIGFDGTHFDGETGYESQNALQFCWQVPEGKGQSLLWIDGQTNPPPYYESWLRKNPFENFFNDSDIIPQRQETIRVENYTQTGFTVAEAKYINVVNSDVSTIRLYMSSLPAVWNGEMPVLNNSCVDFWGDSNNTGREFPVVKYVYHPSAVGDTPAGVYIWVRDTAIDGTRITLPINDMDFHINNVQGVADDYPYTFDSYTQETIHTQDIQQVSEKGAHYVEIVAGDGQAFGLPFPGYCEGGYITFEGSSDKYEIVGSIFRNGRWTFYISLFAYDSDPTDTETAAKLIELPANGTALTITLEQIQFASDNIDYLAYFRNDMAPIVAFQSGQLNGYGFKVYTVQFPNVPRYRSYEYKPVTINGVTHNYCCFTLDYSTVYNSNLEIVGNDTRWWGLLPPQTGDKVALFRIDVPHEWIDNGSDTGASWDLLRAAVRHLWEYRQQAANFTFELDPVWCRSNSVSFNKINKIGTCIQFTEAWGTIFHSYIRVVVIKDYIVNPYHVELETGSGVRKDSLRKHIMRLERDLGSELRTSKELIKNQGGQIAQLVEQVRLDGITAWDSIIQTPVTLGGYGITDAYIQNGVVYLGGQSIAPIVSSDITQQLIIQVLGYTPYDSARLNNDVNTLIDSRVYYDTTGAAHTIHIGNSSIDLNDYVTVGTFNNEVTILSNADTDLSTRIGNEVTARSQADTTLQSYIDIINGKIPSAASTTNKLADKAYVTSMVASATADFKGSWNTWTAVPTDGSQYPTDSEGGHTPKTNDYMVVLQDETHSGQTWRYKYSGTWSVDGKSGWLAEYMVSDAPFTSDQLAAINSGITSTLVTRIGLNRQDIISLNNTKQNTITGAASTVASSNLNTNVVLVSSPAGKIAESTITTSELDYLSGLTTNVQSQFDALGSTYQPLDADLTAIAALSGTSGFLKKTAANTWTLDTNSYITQVDMQLYLAQNYVSQASLTTTLAGYDPMYGTNSGSYSHAIGRLSVASGQYAVATGYNSTASANYAVAMGLNAVASQQNAWALGANTVAAGNNAIAMGYDSVVLANFAMALGAATYVMTQYGISNSTTARTNIATETLSAAISNSRTYTTTVASDLSVGMVVLDNADLKTPLAVITGINRTTNVVTLSAAITVASGQTLAYRKGNSYNTASVAEGYQTASIGGYGSHAEGRFTTAQGQASHAEGWGTWASVNYQHAVGKWNATGNYAEVVGNGTSETQRSNIRTLDWNGNEWVAGNITAGGYIDVSAVKIGGTTINLANAWLQGTATASNVIWVETSGTDYILHIGTTSITVSATGTATSIAWSGITGVPLTLTALGNLAGTTNYGFLKLSGTNQITVDTNSYALATHTHTTNEITDFPQLAEVATSGSYNDLLDLPVLQSVNDATLTLKVNGTTVTTFSANASQNKEFDVDLSSFHSGTVTSVGLTAPAGFEVSDSPITTSGTLALSFATGYSLPTTASQLEWDDAHSATNAATNVNTASTIVKRDENGNFIAGTITANLTGNATTATTATKLGSTSVGSGAKPIWLNQGTPTASTNTIGSATRPIYLNAGTLTAGAYTIASNVPANAVFTDTTYSAGTGLELTGTTFAVNYGTIASGNTLPVSGGAIFTKLADYALISNLATVATTGRYDDLTGIPETFTPAAHTHEWSTISYKPAIIAGTDGLASLNNTTTYGFLKLSGTNQITVDTNSYALTTHTHTISDITNFPTLATVATSGSYTDLDDKPTIPTVYDGVLTLKVNGTTITTFSANSSQNKAFNVDLSEFGGGTVTSVDLSVPTGFVVTGNPVTTSGTLTLAFAAEYSLPTTASQSEWDDAYTATSAATSLNTASTIVKRDASGNFEAGIITATLNGSASKLGTATVGSGVKFIYLDNGNPTVSNSTLGGANQPIWLDNGQLKQCNAFAPVSHTHDWRYDITNKPDTLAGYGITDAYTKAQSDARYAAASHLQAWSTITDTPTTLAGYGLQDDAYTKTQANNVFAYKLHTHTVSNITDFPTLADVATSGDFDDLDNTPNSLAGYGIEDAAITPATGGYNITLGSTTIFIDTSGAASSVEWDAINSKPAIVAGAYGLAALNDKTTYGILRLTAVNRIEVDTTNYANQNAWSSVKIGSTTISAGSVTDMLTLVAGSNVTLTPNALTKTIMLAATDTTYDDATQIVHGLMSTADKTKLDGIAAGANNYSLPTADDNILGGVKTGYSMPSSPSNRYYAVDLDVNDKMFVEVPWENTTYTQATHLVAGLMSAADKTKLDNIEANANFYELPTASASTLGGVKIGYIDNEKNYRVQLDNDKMFVSVPWTDTTYDDATQTVHGLMSTADKTKLDGIAANANNYSLPTANNNTLGGVKTGYESQDNQDYPVQLDINGKMFVSVPWTDTPYSLPLATGETRGGVKIGYSESGRHYAVKLFNEKMYVEVPWTDTTYQRATASTLGLVKIGYDNNGKNYKVQLNTSGQMFVYVPWDNTEYSAGNGLTLTNNTFAVDFDDNIANNGSKAVTGGTIYNYLANYVQKLRDLDFGRLVVASGTYAIDTVNFVPVASATEWDGYNDTYLPTMKSVTDYIGTLGYTANEGTVTSIEIIAGVGIGVSPTGAITTSGEVTVTNMGVRAVATGSANGTISVNTGGDSQNVKVKGIDTAAYKKDTDFAKASHKQGWDTITDTPKTLGGYDIRDAYTKTQTYNKTEADARFAPISHAHSWNDITDDKPNTLFGYGITNAYTKAEVNAMFGSLNVMTFKGSVPTVNALPANASIGDVYVVTDTGTPYVYDGTIWVSLALVDLSDYVTQEELADYATIQYVTTYYATKTEITNMVTSTSMLSQGHIVLGGGNKMVQTLDYIIFPNSSYTGASDFEGINADSYIPTAKAISSYVSGNYQPIGSYVTTTLLYNTLEDYAAKTYVSQYYATLTAIENMVTAAGTLIDDYIVLGGSTKSVKDSGVRILATGTWQSDSQYVPTTSMTDSRYAIRGTLQTGKLVTASSNNTVTATAYVPHMYNTGSSLNTWDGGEGYIPTEAMIDSHILNDMVGHRLQGYHIELTYLSQITKALNTGYIYWNGTSYELATAGSGSGNVSTSGTLDNDYIILGASGTSIKKSTAKIMANSDVWSDLFSPHIATVGNTIGYLSANYQPLNAYLTGISTLPSLSAGGYLYYNGTSWSFSTPSGTGNVIAANTLTNGKLVRGVGDFGIATTNYEVATSGGGSPRTTWDDTSNVYVPTMASIYGRLVALAQLNFAAGIFSAKTYTPSGNEKTINVPTNTSHLTNDSGFITSSNLINYVTYDYAAVNFIWKIGGVMTGDLASQDIYPHTNNQYNLGNSENIYNTLFCNNIYASYIYNTNGYGLLTLGNYEIMVGNMSSNNYISIDRGSNQIIIASPKIYMAGDVHSGSASNKLGTSNSPFNSLYLQDTNNNNVYRVYVQNGVIKISAA